MRSAECDSVFDVVFWLIDRALNDNEYLQPQKLHRMLFLAQAYFVVLGRGKVLMPAVFIAHDSGPIEPNVFRVFESSERPYVEHLMAPDVVEHFLDSLWRRFGHHSAEYLTRMINSHEPYLEARANGPRTEITLTAMARFYGRNRSESEARADGVPNARMVLKPRMMRSQTGAPVVVKPWTPGRAPVQGK